MLPSRVCFYKDLFFVKYPALKITCQAQSLKADNYLPCTLSRKESFKFIVTSSWWSWLICINGWRSNVQLLQISFISMVNPKVSRHPIICYRPIRPSDLEILQKLHADAFPIRYESEFFQNVVNARDIVSWGAVDRSRPNGRSDELIGFVTARIVLANESEIGDLLSCDSLKSDQTLVYILTLGVVETYRNLGIASSLISEVIKYASNIPACRAVYLHVISYNIPAIHLYKKMSFKCVRRLQGFYLINGQHYDSYLFVYYVNGGRSPCSPLELVTVAVSCMRRGLKSVAARLRKNEEKWPKWVKCKESRRLVAAQSRRNLTAECSGCECV